VVCNDVICAFAVSDVIGLEAVKLDGNGCLFIRFVSLIPG
jgi:hypothetical protein